MANCIKVTLKSGEVILARTTRMNINGIVNWIDMAGKWRGKCHMSKVVMATPEEVSKFQKALEATFAPVDPVMVRWTLGKTKRGPMMMEGYYYSIDVKLYGKKVGELVDEGYGGPVMERFNDSKVDAEFHKDCNQWCVNNGGDGSYSSAVEHFWAWWDEARPKGISAKDHFAHEKEQMLKMICNVKNSGVAHA